MLDFHRVFWPLGKTAGALTLAITMAISSTVATADKHEAEATDSTDTWLPSLITETPQEGFALAITLSQKGVATTQPDAEVRKEQRPEYAQDPDSLIAVSHVIATHFQTVAAANDYWRE
ncbi:hexameric tyrosine-coordinated heme protein [Vreelandella salicampi]|nr:hexameric tyrosine-coordinated heme protein [Halomonas salicampi]